MSDKTQYPDLTPEEFEFELRDHRMAAYNDYIRFIEACQQRKTAFEQAQSKRRPLSRWLHALVQHFRNRLDSKRETELLHEVGSYRPM